MPAPVLGSTPAPRGVLVLLLEAGVERVTATSTHFLLRRYKDDGQLLADPAALLVPPPAKPYAELARSVLRRSMTHLLGREMAGVGPASAGRTVWIIAPSAQGGRDEEHGQGRCAPSSNSEVHCDRFSFVGTRVKGARGSLHMSVYI